MMGLAAMIREKGSVERSQYLAGKVKRYHAWPTITQQTVGEHTHGVLVIYCQIFGPPPPEVTVAIAYHDLPEIKTGDPPFGVKTPRMREEYGNLEKRWLEDNTSVKTLIESLSIWQKRRIKWCDVLEMWEFGRYELALGNQYAAHIVEATEDVLTGDASLFAGDDDYEKVVRYMEKRSTRP